MNVYFEMKKHVKAEDIFKTSTSLSKCIRNSFINEVYFEEMITELLNLDLEKINKETNENLLDNLMSVVQMERLETTFIVNLINLELNDQRKLVNRDNKLMLTQMVCGIVESYGSVGEGTHSIKIKELMEKVQKIGYNISLPSDDSVIESYVKLVKLISTSSSNIHRRFKYGDKDVKTYDSQLYKQLRDIVAPFIYNSIKILTGEKPEDVGPSITQYQTTLDNIQSAIYGVEEVLISNTFSILKSYYATNRDLSTKLSETIEAVKNIVDYTLNREVEDYDTVDEFEHYILFVLLQLMYSATFHMLTFSTGNTNLNNFIDYVGVLKDTDYLWQTDKYKYLIAKECDLIGAISNSLKLVNEREARI